MDWVVAHEELLLVLTLHVFEWQWNSSSSSTCTNSACNHQFLIKIGIFLVPINCSDFCTEFARCFFHYIVLQRQEYSAYAKLLYENRWHSHKGQYSQYFTEEWTNVASGWPISSADLGLTRKYKCGYYFDK